MDNTEIKYGNLKEDDREPVLEANADEVKKVERIIPFTRDEKIELKKDLADADIQIQKIEDEKRQAMDKFKERLEPFKKSRDDARKELKRGGHRHDGRDFGFIDMAQKVVIFYDEYGHFQGTRALGPNEKQLTINTKIS